MTVGHYSVVADWRDDPIGSAHRGENPLRNVVRVA